MATDISQQALTMPLGLRVRLSTMMFLQYLMLPVWFVPMFPYVQAMPGGTRWAFWCGLIMGFGTFAAPLFGMFADRFLNAEKVLGLCNLACAGLLGTAYFVKDPAVMFAVLLAVMVFYMPTWSLTATIAMANSTTAAFPHIRVFGSFGWVCAAIFSVVGAKCCGIADFDATPWIFASGAAAALAAGLFAFRLPPTPPKAKGTPMSVVDALGLRALVMFRKPMFCVFAALLVLAMVPFQWYMVYNGAYLKESGFRFLTVTMNLGQAGEVGFMLLVPFVFRRYGYKWAMVMGLGALTFRYACFLGSVETGVAALDFGGILVQGLIFGLLIVGAQMYVDDVAPAEYRNQAQGLVNLIMSGVGVFLSNAVFQTVLDDPRVVKTVARTVDGKTVMAVVHDWSVPYGIALAVSLVLTVAMVFFFRPGKASVGEEP